MAYNFVIREDKMDQLQKDLSDASSKVKDYIEDIYKRIADLNSDWDGDVYQSFVRTSEIYKTPLVNLASILDDFSELVGKFGTDGNTLITNVMRLLDVDERGVSRSTVGVTTVSTERAKDSNGAYIPPVSDYGATITIPSDTKLDRGEDCTEIGNAIYDDTVKTRDVLESEIAYFKAYKLAHMNEIMALPEAQREASLQLLNTQIVERECIVAKINVALTCGDWVSDGAIFNATSNEHTGNVVLGLFVSDQDAVDASVKAASEINNDVQKLVTVGSVDAYMADCNI